jgi:hypothetical protein
MLLFTEKITTFHSFNSNLRQAAILSEHMCFGLCSVYKHENGISVNEFWDFAQSINVYISHLPSIYFFSVLSGEQLYVATESNWQLIRSSHQSI